MAVIVISNNKERLWFSAKWVFNIIIDKILEKNTSLKYRERFILASKNQLGYLDISDFSTEDMEEFNHLIKLLLSDALLKWDDFVLDKEYYAGFILRLEELESLTRSEDVPPKRLNQTE